MRNINKPQERSVSILGLKIEGLPPENTEKVRQALIMLLQCTNFQILEKGRSPQEILQTLGFSIHETEITGIPLQKGRWAKVADRFRKHSMSPEAGKAMDKAIKQFREEFAFKHDLDDNE